MSQAVHRRDAVKAAAAAVGLITVGGTALAGQVREERPVPPEAPPPSPVVGTATLDASQIEPRAFGGGLAGFFARILPDASPGPNILTITGLPSGTRLISVWLTEWAPGDQPHAGDAFFYTRSVQLADEGRRCRVVYHLDWGEPLPAACQVLYGPG
jgi:hypothetical protein